ncbi:MAG: hypothetical protein WBY88_00485, partial [Desulfosarcina sp.]
GFVEQVGILIGLANLSDIAGTCGLDHDHVSPLFVLKTINWSDCQAKQWFYGKSNRLCFWTTMDRDFCMWIHFFVQPRSDRVHG